MSRFAQRIASGSSRRTKLALVAAPSLVTALLVAAPNLAYFLHG